MMKRELYLHRTNEGIMYLLEEKVPHFTLIKEKYSGRRKKIEAIRRYTDGAVFFDMSTPTKEIDKWITENISGKSGWHTFDRINQELAKRIVKEEFDLEFLCVVNITTHEDMSLNRIRKKAMELIKTKQLFNRNIIDIQIE